MFVGDSCLLVGEFMFWGFMLVSWGIYVLGIHVG
jgi:hypothetical protein